jgi:hypothetical protein
MAIYARVKVLTVTEAGIFHYFQVPLCNIHHQETQAQHLGSLFRFVASEEGSDEGYARYLHAASA